MQLLFRIQSHRLKEKSDHQLKSRSLHEWMVGSVILHPGIARQVQSGTIRYLHNKLGKLTADITPMEQASIAVRDRICQDHHDKAIVIDDKGPLFVENWKLSTYQARFGDAAIPRGLFQRHRIPFDYDENVFSVFDTNPRNLRVLEELSTGLCLTLSAVDKLLNATPPPHPATSSRTSTSTLVISQSVPGHQNSRTRH
jgi:hypothetical protein